MAHPEEVQIALTQERPLLPGSNLRPFWIASAILVVLFGRVLYDLVNHALSESLHSHIILIPFISAFLAWQMRDSLPVPKRGNVLLALGFLSGGLVSAGTFLLLRYRGFEISHNDYLSFNVLGFVLCLAGSAAYFLGGKFLKTVAFPFGFLIFMVPLPDPVVNAVEIASQFASAEMYSWFMDLSGATYYRDGRTFVLPNLTIVVAQECSGIRSSLVLFITSLVAGHMFLRSKWKKGLLAGLVFPLGVARNALRIYFLSMASAHWHPDIIHSPLHHRGGPIFFALSLIPFFLILCWLKKSDSKETRRSTIA